jgi:EpsI family protein
VRYLIASFMVGTLFAYLTYRSNRRRVVFVVIALLVAIIANWLRAYIIVMLGHVSGNKLAAGVDHLIYGWLFFGVVIAIIFSIGARWRENSVAAESQFAWKAAPLRRMSRSKPWLAAAVIAFVTIIWKIGYWGIEQADYSLPPRLASLAAAGEWLPVAEGTNWRPHFQHPSAELQQSLSNGSQTVGLFVGYYRNQDYSHKLVSSENVLVKSNDIAWTRVAAGTRNVTLQGQPVAIRTAELRGQAGNRLQVWQWYWINGTLTASDYQAKIYTALSRLRGRGDDSAVIVVYAREDQPRDAQGAIYAFVRAALPEIESRLRETRDVR